MKIIEFGEVGNPIVILIHGFQSIYQVWNEYAEYYKESYHVIVPILPGHFPSNDIFNNLDDVASKIEEYVKKYSNKVCLVFGMSLGGVIGAKILERNKIEIENILFDGSPLVSYGSFVKKFLISTYLKLTRKTKERNKKVINQAVKSIVTEDKLLYFLKMMDQMSEDNIKKYINEIGNYKLPILKINTKIYYFHGTKINEMFSKKTAKFIKKNYSDAKIICFNKKAHCEVSIFDSKKMINEIDKILV